MLVPENLEHRLPCLGVVVPGLSDSVPLPVRYPKYRGPEIPTHKEAYVIPCLLILQVFLSCCQK